MKVRFLFFAQCADWVHRRQWDADLTGPRKIDDLLKEESVLTPIAFHRRSLRVAVNREFSSFNCEVKDGDEVAFIPPVSGG